MRKLYLVVGIIAVFALASCGDSPSSKKSIPAQAQKNQEAGIKNAEQANQKHEDRSNECGERCADARTDYDPTTPITKE